MFNKLIPAKKQFWLFAPLALLLIISTPSRAITLGELYVISSDPLFAEIPICNPGPDGANYLITIATDEEIDDTGNQPFAALIEVAFDTYSDLEGLASLSAQDRAPDDISLIVSLVDQSGETADSVLYKDLTSVRPSPDDFGCSAFLESEEVIEEQQGGEEFIIDTVRGDTWRNIAAMVNIAWYDRRYPIEQVMLSLFKYNNNNQLDLALGAIYVVPDQLYIPDELYPQEITPVELPLASRLDFIGRLKVENRKEPSASKRKELDKLREQFRLLQEQVDQLGHQLNDSQELIRLKDLEVIKLRKNLIDTRQRISTLEKENNELSNTSFFKTINKSIIKNPIEWILGLLVIFGLIVWLVIRSFNQDRKRDIEILRNQQGSLIKKKRW